MESKLKFALLIDADNNSVDYLDKIMAELDAYDVTYRRCYGDWSSASINRAWKKELLIAKSITPVHHFSYTRRKNSTDTVMIIDAMDILYAGEADGFCLVSSDSDFTRLAMRLREAGKIVVGMGKQQTPDAFVKACNKFVYLDAKAPETASAKPAETATDADKVKPAKTQGRGRRKAHKPDGAKPEAHNAPLLAEQNATQSESTAANERGGDKAAQHVNHAPVASDSAMVAQSGGQTLPIESVKELISRIIAEKSKDGWIFAGAIGSQLRKDIADFDVKNYGYDNLTSMLKQLGFSIKRRKGGGSYVSQAASEEKAH